MAGSDISPEQLEARAHEEARKVGTLMEMMSRRLVGQMEVARCLAMAMVARGHVLLEGLPGLAKTTAVRALSDATDLAMSRIQFTPDLLPADVLGTQIYDPKTSEFRIKKGPVFANLVIADEINRAPAKVQSALLQAMQERQVTLGDETFHLPDPFLVMATQNPIEQEGTYQLPEAQIDRFLFKVNVGYTSREEEEIIVARMVSGEEIPIERVLSGNDITGMREFCKLVHVSDKIRRYIVNLVFATRQPAESGFSDLVRLIDYGASPRASIFLEQAARVNAMLEGRGFVTPQDVKDVGAHVLRHRIVLTYEAEADKVSTDEIIRKIFEGVDVP